MKVPVVELKIYPQTVAENYYDMPPSLDCTLDIPSQPPELLRGRQSDVGEEHAASIPDLSPDRRCHPTTDEKLAAAETVDGYTNTATKIISSVLRRETFHSDCQKYLSTSPNISLQLNPNLLSGDELLSIETSSAFRQQSLSTKQTPSSDVDTEEVSDSDNCSDVWVPRTPSAAEAVSGIWIVRGQPTSTADSVPSARRSTERRLHRACKLRAELESPDPVFRRRVAGSYQYSTKWRRTDALDFGDRSSETVERQLTAQERRRAWRVAAVSGRIRHIDSDVTSKRENTSVLSQYASPRRPAAPCTSMRYSSDADADGDGRQETPVVQQLIDRSPRAEASIDKADDRQQQTKDSQNTEQLLHVPVSDTTTTTTALVSSLLERLTSFRHGRSSVHDERHKQQKLIENRARKALRTITLVSLA